MVPRLSRVRVWFNEALPEETAARKVIDLLSLILVVEGIFSIILFSYIGAVFGLVSILVGIIIILVSRSTSRIEPTSERAPGIRLIDYLVRLVGGDVSVTVLGAGLILAILIYNWYVSSRPDIGDADTIAILLGVLLIAYPLIHRKYRVESAFGIIFISFIMLFLVIPQVIVSIFNSGSDSALGSWYVHYMLAEPFAIILDLIGIPASSMGNVVTVQFQDGTLHTLAISAYCAGLYSFSIFLSAFLAFVLVFESFPPKILAVVLALGMVIAYLGNIVRMVIIGVVGYYRGINALHWAHENIGWVIFLIWSSIFWWIVMGYASRKSVESSSSDETEVH